MSSGMLINYYHCIVLVQQKFIFSNQINTLKIKTKMMEEKCLKLNAIKFNFNYFSLNSDRKKKKQRKRE